MKKSTRIVKRFLSLFLVVLMSINTLGAVVSDNDGSAFITKAEFDSLKNDFQTQIDDYNTSIDSKIDGAIAAYLAGIRVSRSEDLELDANSSYVFPLTMYSSATWNDPLNDNFNISIPKTRRIQTRIFWSHHASNLPTGYSNGNSVAGKSGGYRDNAIRLGYVYDDVAFDGKKGQMNLLTKQSTTKALSTSTSATKYYVFNRKKTGIGQYDALYAPDPTASAFSDGSPFDKNTKIQFYYFNMIGYTSTHINQMSWSKSTDAGPTWTGSGTLSGIGYGYSEDTRTPDTNITNATNMNQFLERMKNWTYPSNAFDRTRTYFGSPKSRVLNWSEDGTQCLYNGSAMMSGFVENNWAYTAYVNSDVTKVPVAKLVTFTQSPNKDYVYNTSESSQRVYHFIGTNYEVYPQFVVAANTNHTQNSSNNFSQLRASLVYYEDKNGEKHYLDEGMYLTKLIRGGTVKLSLTFSGASASATLAFSKKPFGWDRQNSDRLKYQFKKSADTKYTEVAKGGTGTVNPGNTYDIVIENLDKGDKLYMCWWQSDTSKTFTLDSLTNFRLETSDD